jgi:hypothetical protein
MGPIDTVRAGEKVKVQQVKAASAPSIVSATGASLGSAVGRTVLLQPHAALRPLNRWIRKKTIARSSRKWIIAAATWKTINAPIHVKNKSNARARNTNLISMTPWPVMIALFIADNPALEETERRVAEPLRTRRC